MQAAPQLSGFFGIKNPVSAESNEPCRYRATIRDSFPSSTMYHYSGLRSSRSSKNALAPNQPDMRVWCDIWPAESWKDTPYDMESWLWHCFGGVGEQPEQSRNAGRPICRSRASQGWLQFPYAQGQLASSSAAVAFAWVPAGP